MIADTPESIAAFRLITLRAALKLECLGMRHSRGSAFKVIKSEFNIKGTKKSVLAQYEAMLREENIIQ